MAIFTFSSQSRPERKGRGLPSHCNLQVHRPQVALQYAGFCLIFYSPSPTPPPVWLAEGEMVHNGSLMWFGLDTEEQSQAGLLALQREILGEFG